MMNIRSAILTGWFLWLFNLLAVSQVPFYSEDFSAPGWPSGWTTVDDSGNPPSFQLFWEKCEAGNICSPSLYLYYFVNFGGLPFSSSTAENGYIFADSKEINLPAGTNLHLSRLTSPAINCTNEDEVILTFETHIGVFNKPAWENAILRVSNNGTNWTEYPLFPDLNQPGNNERFNTNPALIWVDISATAANQNAVYLQWQWEGEEERTWAIDDVKLFSKHPVYNKAIWGTGPGEGLFENGLNGWTNNVLTNDSEWEWTSNGWFGNASSAHDGLYLSSPSYYNGAASFNADFYSTNGDGPIQPPFPTYACELISPIIDLSEADKLLSLRFAQSVRLLNNLPGFSYQTAFAYSLDGGASWSNWNNANPGVPINGYWTPEIFNYSLPEEVLGVSEFRIKFLFNGDFYGWIIDDVLLVEREDNDLAAQENFFAITPSLQTPFSARAPVQFLFDVRNEGALAQTNCEAIVEVYKESGEKVFRDSVFLGQIEADQLIENIQFPNAYMPDEMGVYKGQYYIQSDADDTNPYNDSLFWEFIVNDSIFAKEIGHTGAFTPSETLDYTYGNCFYIPPGPDQKACRVTFGIENSGELLGRKVNIITYELPEGDADGDLEISPSEYQQVGLNDYTFSGLEPDYITTAINFQGNTITLKEDTYYAVMIRYVSTIPHKECYMYASQDYDFQATYILYDQLENPRYFSMLDLDNTGDFDVIGLGDSGFDRIPVVRMHLCNNVSPTSEVFDDFPLKVYPNPASDHLIVETDFAAIDRILITNIEGIQHLNDSSFSSANKHVEINIGQLSPGMYFLIVYDKAGNIRYKKFVRSQAK